MRQRQADPRGWPLAWNWGVFTISDVVEILGIPRRKILLYSEQGILTPSAPARGKGRPSLYIVSDLLEIAVTHHLENFGIAPRRLRDFLLDFFKPFKAGHSVTHITAQRNPHLLIRPEDFDGGGDPLKILRAYAEWLKNDEYAVFVSVEGDEGTIIRRIAVSIKTVEDGMSGETLLDILARHPSAVVINLKNIVSQVQERINKYAMK